MFLPIQGRSLTGWLPREAKPTFGPDFCANQVIVSATVAPRREKPDFCTPPEREEIPGVGNSVRLLLEVVLLGMESPLNRPPG